MTAQVRTLPFLSQYQMLLWLWQSNITILVQTRSEAPSPDPLTLTGRSRFIPSLFCLGVSKVSTLPWSPWRQPCQGSGSSWREGSLQHRAVSQSSLRRRQSLAVDKAQILYWSNSTQDKAAMPVLSPKLWLSWAIQMFIPVTWDQTNTRYQLFSFLFQFLICFPWSEPRSQLSGCYRWDS